MKILELYFVLFSKLYVKFSKKEDDSFYIPLLILSFIICLNLLIVSLLFYNINLYYFGALYFIIYFSLIFLLGYIRPKGKDYIRNYTLSKKTLFFLIFLLIVDFFIVFKTLNYTRDKNMRAKTEKKLKIDHNNYFK